MQQSNRLKFLSVKIMSLIKKFQNISHQYDLWQKGSKIVLGVSGGPDSVCMLDVFAKLQKKYNLELIVAHVNYGLRGEDSDLDQKLVEKLASRHKLKIKTLTLNPSPKGRGGISENALREIRYDFFEKIRAKNKFDCIAVGHTLDDQAETYLMRIIRGSGLAGMASMKHKNNRIIRPFLGIAKKEILEYLDRTDKTYRTDETNKEITFLRNKIRNELIPLLEKKYNPNIKETLYKSSLNIAEDYNFIAQIVKKISHNVIPVLTRNLVNESDLSFLDSRFRGNDSLVILSVKKIIKFHPALQKRVILKAIENIRPNLKDIESSHINEVMKIVKSAKSKRQIIKFQGLKITRIGDKIILSFVK